MKLWKDKNKIHIQYSENYLIASSKIDMYHPSVRKTIRLPFAGKASKGLPPFRSFSRKGHGPCPPTRPLREEGGVGREMERYGRNGTIRA